MRHREMIERYARHPLPALAVMLLILIVLTVVSLVRNDVALAVVTSTCAIPVAVALAKVIVTS